jgi:hypothetical protein
MKNKNYSYFDSNFRKKSIAQVDNPPDLEWQSGAQSNDFNGDQ